MFICVIFLKIPHTNDIIWYLSFYDLLHLVCDNLSVHPCGCKWHYFLLFNGWVVLHWLLYMHRIFFIQSSVDAHLGCFQVLAIVTTGSSCPFSQMATFPWWWFYLLLFSLSRCLQLLLQWLLTPLVGCLATGQHFEFTSFKKWFLSLLPMLFFWIAACPVQTIPD